MESLATSSQRDPLSFLPGVAEKLGWYVYVLRDPRSGAIFYVGKGKGDRVYQHARQAKSVSGESAPRLKLRTINEIHHAGYEVGVEIVRHRMESEDVAYEVEAAVIDALRLAGSDLTNLAAGHGTSRGWRQLEAIIAEYVAKPVPIEHPVVLIRIPNLYESGMTPEALYKATREWWRMNPHHNNPEWAFAVYDGIVRAVYRIERWEQEATQGRWAFDGVLDPELETRYLWTDVSRYLPNGAQNPIKYVNCGSTKTRSKVVGRTLDEFDGVSVATLRAWLRYWNDADRCRDDPAITPERPRTEHIALIEAELKARGARAT